MTRRAEWVGWLRRVGAGSPGERCWQAVCEAGTEAEARAAVEREPATRPWCLAGWCVLRRGETPAVTLRRRLRKAVA
jgi:hypothetical protein